MSFSNCKICQKYRKCDNSGICNICRSVIKSRAKQIVDKYGKKVYLANIKQLESEYKKELLKRIENLKKQISQKPNKITRPKPNKITRKSSLYTKLLRSEIRKEVARRKRT